MIDDTDHLDHSRPRWSWRGGRRPAAASAPCCPASSCESPPPPPPAADTRKTVNIFLQIVSDKIFTWRCATLSWNWYQSALHSPSLRLRSCARSESSGDSTRSSSSSINSPEKSSSSAIVLRINIFFSFQEYFYVFYTCSLAGLPAGVGGAELLDSVSVPQGVQRVLARRHARADHRDLGQKYL